MLAPKVRSETATNLVHSLLTQLTPQSAHSSCSTDVLLAHLLASLPSVCINLVTTAKVYVNARNHKQSASQFSQVDLSSLSKQQIDS